MIKTRPDHNISRIMNKSKCYAIFMKYVLDYSLLTERENRDRERLLVNALVSGAVLEKFFLAGALPRANKKVRGSYFSKTHFACGFASLC